MTDENKTAGESTTGANVNASVAPAAPRKKSAAVILKEYYERRAKMYKEMDEHGGTTR